jgi:hypothetical protein
MLLLFSSGVEPFAVGVGELVVASFAAFDPSLFMSSVVAGGRPAGLR